MEQLRDTQAAHGGESFRDRLPACPGVVREEESPIFGPARDRLTGRGETGRVDVVSEPLGKPFTASLESLVLPKAFSIEGRAPTSRTC